MSEWLTPRQAIKLLGMSKSTFWRRVQSGDIVGRRDGPRTYRFRRDVLEAYIQAHLTFAT